MTNTSQALWSPSSSANNWDTTLRDKQRRWTIFRHGWVPQSIIKSWLNCRIHYHNKTLHAAVFLVTDKKTNWRNVFWREPITRRGRITNLARYVIAFSRTSLFFKSSFGAPFCWLNCGNKRYYRLAPKHVKWSVKTASHKYMEVTRSGRVMGSLSTCPWHHRNPHSSPC